MENFSAEADQASKLTIIRETLGSIVVHQDVSQLQELQRDFGKVKVWIDDPRGHYPIRRHSVGELRAEIGATLHRVYWQDEPYDRHHPGRQFTVRPHLLGAITLSLSPENIE